MRLADAIAQGTVVLDGGLATNLADAGHDLSDELWSARLLADDPEAIVAAHLDYLHAGASVITTASYQATIEGLRRHGYDDPEALLRRSVTLGRQARDRIRDEGIDRPVWIAASVGPYGAALADGSEYRGDYGLTVQELVRFHRPRMALLWEAEPDVLALETIPDVREAEALLTALDGLGASAWLSYTVAGGRTRAGQPLPEAYELAKGRTDIIAVGVNCCAPEEVEHALAVAVAAAGKPAVAYPNSGEEWDARARAWTGAATLRRDEVGTWVDAGARLVGGCCRVGPSAIAAIADTVRERAT